MLPKEETAAAESAPTITPAAASPAAQPVNDAKVEPVKVTAVL